MALHAQPMEWVFFAVSVVVDLLAIWTLREATMDQSIFTAKQVNGPRKAVADSNVREGWFSVGIGLVMTVAAALSLYLKPPPPPFSEVQQTVVFLMAWIAVGALTTISSLLSKSSRRKLMAFADVQHTKTAYATAAPGETTDKPGTEPEGPVVPPTL